MMCDDDYSVFDVNYVGCRWYPLMEQELFGGNRCCVKKETAEKFSKPASYYIDKNVKVGWRGPMLLSSVIENLNDFCF